MSRNAASHRLSFDGGGGDFRKFRHYRCNKLLKIINGGGGHFLNELAKICCVTHLLK